MNRKDHESIIQIVPRLPPVIDAVGDYATNLSEQLDKRYGYKTTFLTGDHIRRRAVDQRTPKEIRVSERSLDTLTTYLGGDSNTVLLHYVGYGYENRGCPVWLVDGLERWQRKNSERKLITMFHEVYACGPVWSSSFWLSPLQKRLAGRLARLSSHCFTNRQEYADVIRRLSLVKDKKVTVLPVFSTVGEPTEMPASLANRKRRLAIFGNSGHRRLVFQESFDALRRTCRAFHIEEVTDIGAQVEHGISQIDGIPVVQTDALPAREVSALLSDSIVGFFNYPTDYLGKSTIFASYC